jgi:hypothetical protein
MVNPGDGESARAALTGDIDLIKTPFDSAWVRSTR